MSPNMEQYKKDKLLDKYLIKSSVYLWQAKINVSGGQFVHMKPGKKKRHLNYYDKKKSHYKFNWNGCNSVHEDIEEKLHLFENTIECQCSLWTTFGFLCLWENSPDVFRPTILDEIFV